MCSHLSLSFLDHLTNSMYFNTLVRFQHRPKSHGIAEFTIAGRCHNWEFDDTATLILHLREVDFQNRAPVDGRASVADKAVYSLEQFQNLSGCNVRLDPFTSITALDNKRVELKTSFPFAPIITHLASAELRGHHGQGKRVYRRGPINWFQQPAEGVTFVQVTFVHWSGP